MTTNLDRDMANCLSTNNVDRLLKDVYLGIHGRTELGKYSYTYSGSMTAEELRRLRELKYTVWHTPLPSETENDKLITISWV